MYIQDGVAGCEASEECDVSILMILFKLELLEEKVEKNEKVLLRLKQFASVIQELQSKIHGK